MRVWVALVAVLLFGIMGVAAFEAQAQQQCQVTGPSCTEAKKQCHQIRRRLYPGKSNNPCANRYRRCMANGRWVSRTCNVPMQKS